MVELQTLEVLAASVQVELQAVEVLAANVEVELQVVGPMQWTQG